MSNTYVIGDIHGHLNALNECLEVVSFDNENDTLISLGDLVDRGPESYEVIEKMMSIKNLVQIMGNHDMWLMEALDGYGDRHWLGQGGQATLDSYVRNNWLNREKHLDFLKNMKGYHVQDNMAFVHGGLVLDIPLEKQQRHHLAWNRDMVYQMMSCTGRQKLKSIDKFDKIFIGHTPTIVWDITKPINRGGVWNLDTGCGKGGKLTIFNLYTDGYYQTKTTFK